MLQDIKTRRCKKCGGDLYIERDQYGVYISCIQCGAVDAELAELALTKDGPKYMTRVDSTSDKTSDSRTV